MLFVVLSSDSLKSLVLMFNYSSYFTGRRLSLFLGIYSTIEEYELAEDYLQLKVGLTNYVEEVIESTLRCRLGILKSFLLTLGLYSLSMMLEQ